MVDSQDREQQNQDHRASSGSQPSGQESDNDEFDPGYCEWRSKQMQKLDNEYRTWRLGGSKVFSDEFRTWRDERRKSDKQVERTAEHDPLEHDETERAPDDQGNAITSQEQNEDVAQRTLDQQKQK